MFNDDEDELELLRQYEDQELDASEDDARSSDRMDSDLEDKIMSMVQYGAGIVKKKAPQPQETSNDDSKESIDLEVVHAPVDLTKSTNSKFSFSNELQLNDSDLEEDTIKRDPESEDDDKSAGTSLTAENTEIPTAEPQVTRYINLDEKYYMDDEETSEEEAELNTKLQELIEDQIYNRQSKKRVLTAQTIRVCFSCHQPGHERKDCKLCMDCGRPKHKDMRCVGARYCSRCKQRGHSAVDCENDRNSKNCGICNTSYHASEWCPSLLHTYTNESPATTTPTAWCYNCTDKGHYGDECPYLPQYLTTLPSAFSKLSVTFGNRFDPKKSLKSSASSFNRHSNSHHRFSDSSRESSPRREYNNDKNSNYHHKRVRYNNNQYDSDDSFDSRGSSKKKYKSKGRYNDSNSQLDHFFNKNKGNSNNIPQKSGNNNWKALNNSSLPQPTRTGTVNISNNNNKGYGGDFPRGNINLPRPSSSGVIDLTGDSSNNRNDYPRKGPKYRGGYNRNR